jgi:hypothetical protein
MTVQGSKEIISTISQDSITVYIDLDGFPRDPHRADSIYASGWITVSSISMSKSPSRYSKGKIK